MKIGNRKNHTLKLIWKWILIQIPIISVKSPSLQDALGVTTTKSVKRKLLCLGVKLIDDEYVSCKQLDEILDRRLESDNGIAGAGESIHGSFSFLKDRK